MMLDILKPAMISYGVTCMALVGSYFIVSKYAGAVYSALKIVFQAIARLRPNKKNQFSQRIQELEQKLESLNQNKNQAAGLDDHHIANTTSHSNYDEAIQLARSGCTPQDLVTRCRLTWGEAELLFALHH